MTHNDQDRVIREFQRRRKNMLRKFAFCIALLALALISKQLSELMPSFLGMDNTIWSALAGFLLIAGVAFGAAGVRQYRCPICEEIIRGGKRDLMGVFLDLQNCPKCGAPLS